MCMIALTQGRNKTDMVQPSPDCLANLQTVEVCLDLWYPLR